jgi:hypothetical protein
MYLDAFHVTTDGFTRITAEQGSRFAKEIAGDFNPIHNPGVKRFVVPGDLLFSLVLERYGLSECMAFSFTDMVGANVDLDFPDTDAPSFEIGDATGRVCLKVRRDGRRTRDMSLLERFTLAYVSFSGQTFPHVLVPLMRAHDVMINPQRPLVIYEGMSFDLEHPDIREPELELGSSSLIVNGKRGDVSLDFVIRAGGRAVGTGAKKLVLSGLRPYDDAMMQALVDEYAESKAAYRKSGMANKG